MPREPGDRAFRDLVFALFPYPRRLRAMIPALWLGTKLGLTRVAAGPLGKLLPPRLAPARRRWRRRSRCATRSRSSLRAPRRRDERRARVALVAGCVQRAFFPNVNAATIRVLSAEGCEVLVPRGQGCCGALSLHSGRPDEAKRFARALIERFAKANGRRDHHQRGGLRLDAQRVRRALRGRPGLARARDRRSRRRCEDVNEYLATLEPRAPRKPIALRVAYHDACHLAHAQRVRAQPRELLRTIPGLELLEIPEGDQCCGSAGTYNLFQPESAHEIGVRKVDNVQSVAPDLVASANPGCTLQMQSIFRERGVKLRAAHPIELLDAAIHGTPLG